MDAKGRFTYTFRASPPNASGSLAMTTVKAVAVVAQKKKRKLVVVRKAFKVPASGRVKVRLKLGKKPFKVLKRAKTLKVKTVVKLGTKRASRQLTLKAPKKKKRRR